MAHDAELVEILETIYDSQNPTRRWLHRSRRDWIIDTVRSLDAVGRALEVGPGSGIYLPTLAEVAQEVVAADIDSACLSKARELQGRLDNLRCVDDDVTKSRLEPGSFDLILCSEVIEHIADSPAALRGMHGLASSEGVLVLSTPQRYSPLEICCKVAFLPGVIQLVRWIYGEAVFETGHINLLTESRLKQQLATAGFDIVTEHKSGFYLPLVAEFGGRAGQRFLGYLEATLRHGKLSGLLWTQYYVLRKHETEPS